MTNTAPVAQNDVATTDEDVAVDISVLVNDSDADNDTLEVAAIGTPKHGTAVAIDTDTDGVMDSITYTPDPDFHGTDTFKYFVNDGGAAFLPELDFGNGIELSDLDGTNGFTLAGPANSQSGHSVSSAGDVNGDGIDDIIIGARTADLGVDVNGNAGRGYVVFGSSSGFAADIDLTALNGSDGFSISGIKDKDSPTDYSGDYAGWSVSGAGDVNGDNIDDVIISAPRADTATGEWVGEVYVVFGSNAGFAADINLSSLNGANGFTIEGKNANDHIGDQVSSAGDVNGDGIDDILIGAERVDPDGKQSAGEAYVIFGSASAFSSRLSLSDLNGANGFTVAGLDAVDGLGESVSSAGDINGDGIDDIILGADQADPDGVEQAGESYVIFGKSTGFGSSFELSDLDGTNGFTLNGNNAGDSAGFSVSNAGDINGDNIDDLLIGATGVDLPGAGSSGAVYVVFGRTTGFSADLELSSLDGTNGFIIEGAASGDQAGFSVSAAGDVDSDGIDDLIIGAPNSDFNGDFNPGRSFVVFGSTNGFSASLELSDLIGGDGFALNGIAESDFSGYSVSSAGDINNDGADDFIVSAPLADNNGQAGGASYVVFGKKTSGDVATVTVTVNSVNDDPVAANDAFIVHASKTVTGSLFGDNGNGIDDDVDGDNLSVVAVNAAPGDVGNQITLPSGALLTLNSDGTFDYDPNNAFVLAQDDTEADNFTYTVSDGNGGTDTATVAITINLENDDPVAANDAFVLYKYLTQTGDVFADNGNGIDDDIDGDPISVIEVNGAGGDVGNEITLASGALLTLNSDGSFDYDPNASFDHLARFATSNDSFTYTVGDGVGGTDIATVTLTVEGSMEGTSGADTLDGSNRADIIGGANQNDLLRGNGGDDQLFGDSGEDRLHGGAGNDTMDGGGGDDLYFVHDAGDVLVERVGGGDDFVFLWASIDLSGTDQEVEEVRIMTADDHDVVMNDLANIVDAHNGNNHIRGLGGDDILFGDGGKDTLDGGAGVDTLVGGSGSDLYIVDDTADDLRENTASGTDVVRSTANYTLTNHFEKLELLGSANLAGSGNALANKITGNSGNNVLNGGGGKDTLDGGAGRDTMNGGNGDDLFKVDHTGDKANGGAGRDRVEAKADFTLANDVEDLTLLGNGNLKGIGNNGKNVIVGNSGKNNLVAKGGDDTLNGNNGADTLKGDNGKDKLKGGNGNDQLFGGDSGDRLEGGSGSDFLKGDAGNDRLIGNSGSDTAAYAGAIGRYKIVKVGSKVKVTDKIGNLGTDTLSSIEKLKFGNKVMSVNKALQSQRPPKEKALKDDPGDLHASRIDPGEADQRGEHWPLSVDDLFV